MRRKMAIPLVRERPRAARPGQYCDGCAHGAAVADDAGLPVRAAHVLGCSMHERLVFRAVWCEEWEKRRGGARCGC